ncbi:hypothetical protein V8C86DRAFT_3209110 [Haematococcus lacustris]
MAKDLWTVLLFTAILGALATQQVQGQTTQSGGSIDGITTGRIPILACREHCLDSCWVVALLDIRNEQITRRQAQCHIGDVLRFASGCVRADNPRQSEPPRKQATTDEGDVAARRSLREAVRGTKGWNEDGTTYSNPDMQELMELAQAPAGGTVHRRAMQARNRTVLGGLRGGTPALLPAAGAQFVFVSTDDADDDNHCSSPGACGRLYPNVLSRAYALSATNSTNNILAVGVNGRSANTSFVSWLSQAGLSGSAVTYALTGAQIAAAATANFTGFRVIYVPSAGVQVTSLPSWTQTTGGIQNAQSDALALFREQLRAYINVFGGSLVVLTQQGLRRPFSFFPSPLQFVALDFVDVSTTPDITQISPDSDSANLDHNAWHGYFTGPQDWSGIYRVLAFKAWKDDSNRAAGGPGQGCPVPSGPTQDCWATVLCNQYTYLSAEICGNAIDDDGNGLADKADPVCWRPPPPPSPVLNTLSYCTGQSGVCQNCQGNCSSADSGGTDSAICQLPASLQGHLPSSQVCSDPNFPPASAPMIYSTPVLAGVSPTAAGGAIVYTAIGTATVFFLEPRLLKVTVVMSCPWMIWSSPTDANGLVSARIPLQRVGPYTNTSDYYSCPPPPSPSPPPPQLLTYSHEASSSQVSSCVPAASMADNATLALSFCWNFDCLAGTAVHAAALTAPGITITAPDVPLTSRQLLPAGAAQGAAIMVNYLLPDCINAGGGGAGGVGGPLTAVTSSSSQGSSASTSLTTSNSLTVLPNTSLDRLTMNFVIPSLTCSDQFATALITTAVPAASQPAIPTASCPCWAAPGAGGVCPGIQVPVTLSTISAAEGKSFQQCIDPANFDFWTGRLAYSFCWRYACLPDTFSTSDFNATVTDLTRFNIARMPGGVVYNATVQATRGVKVSVLGKAKSAAEPSVVFDNSGTALPNGDWVSGNVSLPAAGVSNFTFVYYVPMGFDDLSAAVTMVDAGQAEALCVPLPAFDIFAQQFAFSTCWRWSCLSLAFRGPQRPEVIKPYTITVTNITQYNLDQMPGGTSRLTLLKPLAVNMSLLLHPVGDSSPDALMGPFTSAAALLADTAGVDMLVWTRRWLADLDGIVSRASAAIQADISSYLLSLPVAFTDFTALTDCSAASRTRFTASVAASLGLSATSVSATCRLGSNSGARRRGRALAQSSPVGSLCADEAVRAVVQVSLGPGTFASQTPDQLASAASGALQSSFASTCGFGVASTATLLTLTVPAFRSLSPASASAACADLLANNLVAGIRVAGQSCSQHMLNPDGSVGPLVAASAPPTSALSKSAQLIAGLVGGLGAAALLVALAVIRARRNKPAAGFKLRHGIVKDVPLPYSPDAVDTQAIRSQMAGGAGDDLMARSGAAAAARRGMGAPSTGSSRPSSQAGSPQSHSPRTQHLPAAAHPRVSHLGGGTSSPRAHLAPTNSAVPVASFKFELPAGVDNAPSATLIPSQPPVNRLDLAKCPTTARSPSGQQDTTQRTSAPSFAVPIWDLPPNTAADAAAAYQDTAQPAVLVGLPGTVAVQESAVPLSLAATQRTTHPGFEHSRASPRIQRPASATNHTDEAEERRSGSTANPGTATSPRATALEWARSPTAPRSLGQPGTSRRASHNRVTPTPSPQTSTTKSLLGFSAGDSNEPLC